ncbi:hypothetical protein Y032_0396g684 [Ancylostoma ceylanicum]|uniref:Uncharacterized protein n=1 Tax=Ancylostoma ceylanicum TaxID=53326 RepID=A0A016RRL8_9BILA|nr:hypothetical protein Y032_0396g684 [Ancylostoma ceylanicum]
MSGLTIETIGRLPHTTNADVVHDDNATLRFPLWLIVRRKWTFHIRGTSRIPRILKQVLITFAVTSQSTSRLKCTTVSPEDTSASGVLSRIAWYSQHL